MKAVCKQLAEPATERPRGGQRRAGAVDSGGRSSRPPHALVSRASLPLVLASGAAMTQSRAEGGARARAQAARLQRRRSRRSRHDLRPAAGPALLSPTTLCLALLASLFLSACALACPVFVLGTWRLCVPRLCCFLPLFLLQFGWGALCAVLLPLMLCACGPQWRLAYFVLLRCVRVLFPAPRPLPPLAFNAGCQVGRPRVLQPRTAHVPHPQAPRLPAFRRGRLLLRLLITSIPSSSRPERPTAVPGPSARRQPPP